MSVAIGANVKLVEDAIRMLRQKNRKIGHLRRVVRYSPLIKSSKVMLRFFYGDVIDSSDCTLMRLGFEFDFSASVRSSLLSIYYFN